MALARCFTCQLICSASFFLRQICHYTFNRTTSKQNSATFANASWENDSIATPFNGVDYIDRRWKKKWWAKKNNDNHHKNNTFVETNGWINPPKNSIPYLKCPFQHTQFIRYTFPVTIERNCLLFYCFKVFSVCTVSFQLLSVISFLCIKL